MFPGCPEHCNAEETLSEYSRNIACRLGKSFKYKTKLIGNTEADEADRILENTAIAVPLEY